MANPRKFSEKIALHNQKQAEETAAFEAILREVSATTRPPLNKNVPQQTQPQAQHMHLAQPNLGIYKGGSLPNVNQIGSNTIDLQNALQGLEDMKQATGRTSLVDRLHRDRSNRQSLQGHRSSRPFPIDKRVDVSPYGSAYLSPPPDSSWRRSTSDSALHTSAMAPQQHLSGTSTPTKCNDVNLEVKTEQGLQAWDPKNAAAAGQSRPKSCEVPGINIYPSPEQDSGIHIPISSNTGSLPDLSNLHFPSPMVTPLDAEDQAGSASTAPSMTNYSASPGNLSPTTPHHLQNLGQSQPASQATSPGERRRQQTQPTPLQLHRHPGTAQQELNLSRLAMEQSRHMYGHTYHPYVSPTRQQHQQLPPNQLTASLPNSQLGHSKHEADTYSLNHLHPNVANQRAVSPQHHQPSQLAVETHNCAMKANSTPAYRNSSSDAPQSPTSPLSQTSYSPSQSPGLPPANIASNASFTDAYFSQEANALQHQLEQFSMLPENVTVQQCLFNISQPQQQQQQQQPQLQQHSQAAPAAVSMAAQHQQPFSPPATNTAATMNGRADQYSHHNCYYTQSVLSSSPHHSPQTTTSPVSVGDPLPQSPTAGHQYSPLHHNDPHFLSASQNKIPDIILTGADDLSRQDFAKEISNAMAGMTDSFDSELYPSDEALKVGLDPLDLEELKMLTDPDLVVSDPAAEDSFRLDRL